MIEVTVSAWLQIIQIIVVIVGGGVVVGTLKTNVTSLTQRMIGVETQLNKLVDVLVNQARQEERLTAVERRIDTVQNARSKI